MKREWKTSVKLGLFMSPEHFKIACKRLDIEIRSMNYMGGMFRKEYDIVLYGNDVQFYTLIQMLKA